MKQSLIPAPILLSLPYDTDTLRHFHTINEQLPMALLLQSDTTTGNANKSTCRERFDILTAAPEFWLQTHDGNISWQGKQPPELPLNGLKSFSALHQLLEHIKNIKVNYDQCIAEDLPFCGGLIGYCSYDLNRNDTKLTGNSINDIDIPDMQFGFYGWACIQDHATKKCWLVIHPACDKDLAKRLPEILHKPQCIRENIIKKTASDQLSNDMTAEEYTERFEKIIGYIKSGDCYQVNLSQRFKSKSRKKPLELYEELREVMPSPFSAFFPILGSKNSDTILSFSPERFISINRNKKIISQPIKGTSERFSDAPSDHKSAKMLIDSEKCKSENLMIVDLLRNDLGRVCEIGSIKVSKLFELQSFSSVHHLVSTIQGTLKEGLNGADVLEACFPGGSITGAPKIRAMQIIDEIETTRRSIYCGSLVAFSAHGTMDSNIMIRTVLLKNGEIYCWAGGGIVSDSDCRSEYEESFNKVRLILDRIK
jgi:para-aminobenzoate synthetase component 1